MSEKFYITTPLYYVNAAPHLGGTYTTIVADTISKYKRMMGFDVKFLTGTDEHGQKIERSAKEQGIEPIELVERVYKQYSDLWKNLQIPYDESIRTTDDRHHVSVQEVYSRVKANGFTYKGEYSGWYCVSCEAYSSEADPKASSVPCPDCGRETEWFSEESYFFKLSELQKPLLEHYERNPDFVKPETRRNEVVSFVKGGLRDISISRSTLKWGVSLPDDPEHVFYVWFDALIGYMSGIGYQSDSPTFEKYWPANLHLVGKDILRFHAVYWPAFLLAADLPIPTTIFGHGWWLFNDEKMSKSRGNVLDPVTLTEVFDIELIRYYLLREMVFGQDCNFSVDAIIQRANSDLANDLGNLLSRTVAMIGKYRNGIIPGPGKAKGDSDVEQLAIRTIADFRDYFDVYNFSRGLETIWALIGRMNKYIVENQPWAIAKDEAEAECLDSVLFHSAESLRIVASLLAPTMPKASESIWNQLGLDGKVAGLRLDELNWGETTVGRKVQVGPVLFPRIDKKGIYASLESNEGEKETMNGSNKEKDSLPMLEPTITIDDFVKLDLRVGTVLEAERVKKSDKLLRVVVDIGLEKRQIVAGLAKFYDPEKLIGRQVVIAANLQPRKLLGIESNGMIIAASVGSEDRPVLIGFQEEVVNGSRLK